MKLNAYLVALRRILKTELGPSHYDCIALRTTHGGKPEGETAEGEPEESDAGSDEGARGGFGDHTVVLRGCTSLDETPGQDSQTRCPRGVTIRALRQGRGQIAGYSGAMALLARGSSQVSHACGTWFLW